MINEKFGKLVVLERVENSKEGRKQYRCLCECGGEKTILGKSLRNGTKSCGCLRIEKITKENPWSNHFMYDAWCGMKQRCLNPKHHKYQNYGGSGITICDEWKESFLKFLGDMGERPEGCSLDRIDNLGPYSKENCKWSTPKEQANNRRKRYSVKVRREDKT